jgi:uncharacterized repeat protein (TIGR03803 family)
MNSRDFVRKKNRRLTSVAILLLALSLAATAHAQGSGTINQLFAFTCTNVSNGETCPQGARPDIILQASDGNFYGAAQVTDEGVSDPQGGTLFKLTPSGEFTKLFTFTRGSSGFLHGNNPASGFVEANDGFLYGTTFNGGKQNDGVLFRITKTGTDFKLLRKLRRRQYSQRPLAGTGREPLRNHTKRRIFSRSVPKIRLRHHLPFRTNDPRFYGSPSIDRRG